MNADEIVAYFADEVDPVCDTRQDKGKKIYYAILQSLFPPPGRPKSAFSEVVESGVL